MNKINNMYVKFFDCFKTILAVIIIAISSNSFVCASDVPIEIEPLTALENSKLSTAVVLNEEKLLLYSRQKNNLAVYDVKNNVLNENVPELKPAPIGYEEQLGRIAFDKLLNGDILIRSFFERRVNKKIFYKAYCYIFSVDKNKVIFEAELPEKIAFYQASVVNLDNDRLLFIGADDDKKTYIYNIQDKKLTEAAETIEKRRGCTSILLKDGRVFVWGGYSDNDSAELYDIKQNKFITKIPMGFVNKYDFGRDELYMLDDGKVVIRTTKIEEKKEDGVGIHCSSSDGTGYPVPYVIVFNPQDNSFKPININKNQKYKHSDFLSTVTSDGKFLMAGGELINKKGTKRMGYARKLTIYDLKSDEIKLSKTKLDPSMGTLEIYALNDKNIVVFYGPDWGFKYKNHYIKINFK